MFRVLDLDSVEFNKKKWAKAPGPECPPAVYPGTNDDDGKDWEHIVETRDIHLFR
jgi:hypothetical protein